jgi:hypothetical protein
MAEENLDVERDAGFEYQIHLWQPFRVPQIVYGFQVFEQSKILDPYHRSERKVKTKFSEKKTNAHDLYGFQRRQQRKARHEELHPHRVLLVHVRVVGKLRTQHAL